MRLRQRIVDWTGWDWAGWRKLALAGGSALINGIALALLAGSLTAGGAEIGRARMSPSVVVSVTLVSETPPSQPRQAAPAEPTPARPSAATPTPQRADFVPDKRRPRSPSVASGGAKADGEDGVYLGPPGVAQAGPPLGLRGLLKKDPCNNVVERLRGDCDLKWGKLLAEGEIVQEPSIEQLKRMYPGFVEEPSCGSSHMGCLQADWRSSIGTRPIMRGPASGGPASLGGPAAGVGRLPPANEYQRDPGFGD
ncbi:MAG: hypothetical protein GC155_04090 [Alphaproteobacteria bacterium]|nr:hypothetical protein [Alphaproteobacteria bacterium]